MNTTDLSFEKYYSSYSGNGIVIAVIDSGINTGHPYLKKYEFHGVSLQQDQDGKIICEKDNIEDTIGHGTAVSSIIKNIAPHAELKIIKVYQENYEIDTALLIYTLNYIKEHVSCHIVHLSSGVVVCDQIPALRKICRELSEKGVIIAAAFDNGGALSFPAAFPGVLGIDLSIHCPLIFDYEYVESDCINIRGRGINQRVPWLNSDYKQVVGSSFAAPYITGMIARIMESGIKDAAAIHGILKKYAKRVHPPQAFEAPAHPVQIKKGIVFPFNKEVHSLAANSDMLNFDLVDIFSLKYSGDVGKKASVILNRMVPYDYTVKNLDALEWESSFDTLIIGHVHEISGLLKKDIKAELIQKCLHYGKNVYCFDGRGIDDNLIQTFRNKGLSLFYPEISGINLPKNRFGKHKVISCPVLGVFGTSSIQGKFHLQLSLRKLFITSGYKVGQLGTEPTGFLYGMNEVYPFGYDAPVKVAGIEAVAMINYLMERIEEECPDIIIVGSQSISIPPASGNNMHYPVCQTELLFGTNPDVFVLCINITDSSEYIMKTINFLESGSDGKVIALALFPLQRRDVWAVLGNEMTKVDNDMLEQKRKSVEAATKRKVFFQGIKTEIDDLYGQIIDFF